MSSSINYRNYTQNTNFIAGSDKLKLLPFYLTEVNIPGLNFNIPEVFSRGIKVGINPDNITFNNLTFNVLIDEDYRIYHEFMDIVFASYNPESGSFTGSSFNNFDFWIEINNNKSNKLFKIEFYNCKLESIGDLSLDTKDDGSNQNVSIEVKYDYFKIIKDVAPTLAV